MQQTWCWLFTAAELGVPKSPGAPGLWGACMSLSHRAAHQSPTSPWQEGLRAERHVSHLHYTAWPDHGIPESTTSIMTFRELVREHIQSTKDAGPTLVHCRCGSALGNGWRG